MIGKTQRCCLKVAKALGIDHVGIVPLVVLHSILNAIELSFLTVRHGIVGRGECHLNGGTLATVDAAQGDRGFEVQAVVSAADLFAIDLDGSRCLLAGQGECVFATCGHVLVAALASTDGDGELFSVALVGEGCGGIFADVVLVLAVVLVEGELILVAAREDAHNDGLLRAAQVLYLAIVGKDAACLDIDRIFVH